MLKSANDVTDFSIGATDGDIGRVQEFYFDEAHWTVRYIVVNTGGWFNERKVLISPYSVEQIDWQARHIETPLTRLEVQASPPLESSGAISRADEAAYNGHYDIPNYWDGAKLWGATGKPDGRHSADRNPSGDTVHGSDASDSRLRGTRQIVGYGIAARDGAIGHVDDFIIDDATWTIRYLVIDTRNWWPGKKVLLSPRWIKRVSWQERKVFVDLRRREIKNSPEYDDTASIEREYEERLYEYYGETGYWQSNQTEPIAGGDYGTGSR